MNENNEMGMMRTVVSPESGDNSVVQAKGEKENTHVMPDQTIFTGTTEEYNQELKDYADRIK